MKKLIVTVALLLGLALPVAAEGIMTYTDFGTHDTIVVGVKDLAFGTYYDKTNSRILFGGSLPVISYKNLISLNIGMITDSQSNPWIGGVSLNINTFAKMLDMEYHLPGDLQLGVFVGKNFDTRYDTSKFWGFSANTYFQLIQ